MKKKSKKNKMLGHLQAMYIWASLALDCPEFGLTDAMYKSMAEWTKELIEWVMDGQHENK